MRTFFIGIGYLVTISLYIFFILLPYYIAYSFIEPRSFLGVVGVFIFGSVIVPLVGGVSKSMLVNSVNREIENK